MSKESNIQRIAFRFATCKTARAKRRKLIRVQNIANKIIMGYRKAGSTYSDPGYNSKKNLEQVHELPIKAFFK